MKRNVVKAFSLFFVIVMLITSLNVCFMSSAAKKTKDDVYDIRVVFDNSGSMYGADTKNPEDAKTRWCRAKYAMEIFASMLPFNNGSTLSIYTLGAVTTNKNSSPVTKITLKSRDDISEIDSMYSTNNYNTPFAPVKDAISELSGSKISNKYLVIMSDGAFDEVADQGMVLQSELASLAKTNNNIKFQYLGFGNATKISSNGITNLFVPGSSDLQDALIEICNNIFNRDLLSAEYDGDEDLKFDISMENLFIVAQGKNVKVDLSNVKKQYSQDVETNKNTKSVKQTVVDKWGTKVLDLNGCVASFTGSGSDGVIKKGGNYHLKVTGATSYKIYYEPAINLNISLTTAEGKEYNIPGDNDNIPVGEYTLNYKLIDKGTNEVIDVNKNSQILKGVTFEGSTCNADGKDISKVGADKKVTITEDVTGIKVRCTYLDGKYEIKNYDESGRLKNGYSWKNKEIGKDALKCEIQDHKDFDYADEASFKDPVVATFSFNGQPVDVSKLSDLKVTDNGKPISNYSKEGSNVKITFNKTDLLTGEHKIEVSAFYYSPYGKTPVASATWTTKYELPADLLVCQITCGKNEFDLSKPDELKENPVTLQFSFGGKVIDPSKVTYDIKFDGLSENDFKKDQTSTEIKYYFGANGEGTGLSATNGSISVSNIKYKADANEVTAENDSYEYELKLETKGKITCTVDPNGNKKTLGGGYWINTSSPESNNPIIASVELNGDDLSFTENNPKVDIVVTSGGANVTDLVEIESDDSSVGKMIYRITFKKTADGKQIDCKDGTYNISVSASYDTGIKGKDGNIIYKGNANQDFIVESFATHNAKLIAFGIAMLILLVIAAIVLWFIFIKSWFPKRMYRIDADGARPVSLDTRSKRGRADDVTFVIAKNKKTNLLKRGTNKAKIKIKKISFTDSPNSFTIQGTTFINMDGIYKTMSGEEYNPDEEYIIEHEDDFSWVTSVDMSEGKILMNQNHE